MNVEHEVKLLIEEIKRLGSPNADGQVSVKFGVLFNDDRCANIFEGKEVSKEFLNIILLNINFLAGCFGVFCVFVRVRVLCVYVHVFM